MTLYQLLIDIISLSNKIVFNFFFKIMIPFQKIIILSQVCDNFIKLKNLSQQI